MEITRDTTSLQGKTPVWAQANGFAVEQLPAGRSAGRGRAWGWPALRGEAQRCRQHRHSAGLLADGHGRLLRSGPAQPASARVEVSLSASNLFNKTYYSCYDQNNCWFGAERSVEARLKYVF